ncbi:S9 family peptidase [Sphingosinicella sp. CPCC 101087]|uniref:alpha/beta hydrolase family protein n=1 Tax=Sphingosinicella sp. CPCC 101087 TaxID=2497754 RepID=UPI00101E036B|nr:alpha/beta hydrolase [Sphingosinicella sp. CPCC 101087]
MKFAAFILMAFCLAAPGLACEAGAYRSPSGDLAVLTTPAAGGMRYTFFDGRRGPMGSADAPIRCDGERIVGAGGGDSSAWAKVPLKITRTDFESEGVRLAGELIEPADAGATTPLVVMAHGSENTGWIGGRVAVPYILAANGISAFIFDKRGTGSSQGEFHMNFRRLAQDLSAAAAHARTRARGRHGPLGLHGFSQGGWVAPLAAERVQPDFIVVNYGLVLSPQEEDAEEVETELKALGYGPDVLAKAREVTGVTGALIASGFTEGFDALDRLRRAYGDEPWFGAIEGEFTGGILALDEATLRREGRERFDRLDIDWDYDPIPVLRAVLAPVLWIGAGNDRAAPPEVTLERLGALRREGRPIQIAMFPRTDHGILEYIENPDGTRTGTRHAPGYFPLLVDWTKGCLTHDYGDVALTGVTDRRPDCR